jgi:hypothetical protein
MGRQEREASQSCETLHALVPCGMKQSLQCLLHVDKDYQSLICGLVHMNKSDLWLGPHVEDPGDKLKCIGLLGSIAGNVDCFAGLSIYEKTQCRFATGNSKTPIGPPRVV